MSDHDTPGLRSGLSCVPRYWMVLMMVLAGIASGCRQQEPIAPPATIAPTSADSGAPADSTGAKASTTGSETLPSPAVDTATSTENEARDARRAAFLRHLVAEVIVPGYTAFATASRRFFDAAGKVCADSSADSLDAAQAQWRDAMAAWQGIGWLRLGPVRAQHRGNRILAWPGASGPIVAERIGQALARTEGAAIDEAWIARQPVHVQGLQALEWLLFSPDSPVFDGNPTADSARSDRARHCELLVAIAANLRTNANLLEAAWSDPSKRDLTGRGLLALREKSIADVFNAVANEIMRLQNDLRHQKLGLPLGLPRKGSAQLGPPAPFPGESNWSHRSLDNLRINLEVIERVMGAVGEPGLDSLLRAAGHSRLSDQWRALLAEVNDGLAIAQAERALVDIQQDSTEAVAALRRSHGAMAQADELYQKVIMAAMGARAVFNFNDGD